MTPIRRRPLIWLALAAMLAMALLPTVSHTLAFVRGGAAAWAEVCTPQGLRVVAGNPGEVDRGAVPLQAAGQLAHCPLCTLAADHPGLPAAPLQAGVLLRFDAVRLPPATPLQRSLPTWPRAQPRGPPAAA